MQNQDVDYDNQFHHDNVYGHCVQLLRKHSGLRRVQTDGPRIHLDIGCGFGRIAEPISTELGYDYVGLDANPLALTSLRERNFEAHSIDLESPDFESVLERIVKGREIASISCLDTLEHLVNGDRVLRALTGVAAPWRVPIILSVPNVTHQDIAFRLLSGDFDYTADGLLDHTHVRLFSAESLLRLLNSVGLHPFDSYNVSIEQSDQHFPGTHPALSESTTLGGFLRQLRKGAKPDHTTNQFIWACLPGPETRDVYYWVPPPKPAPFLSIVMRTQGLRNQCVVEALTCLAGQTCTDFEVLVIGHKLSPEGTKILERTIDDCPEWLRVKISLIKVDAGTRTRPLNEGFAASRGDYIAILDDDDLPFANWVESFKELSKKYPGRLLRHATVRQDVTRITLLGADAIMATGPLKTVYPSSFNFTRHLHENQTPPISVAFPSGVFHAFGIHFDESLTTTEDWDYIMRVAIICGVADSATITSIYRWWVGAESSRTVHAQEEWDSNRERIYQKMDSAPLLLPSGSSAAIRALFARSFELDRIMHSRAGTDGGLTADEIARRHIASVEEERLRLRIVEIFDSTSWKISAPLRFLTHLMRGGKRLRLAPVMTMDKEHLQAFLDMILSSRSWQCTGPLRSLRRPGTR
jgi:2-polyprenyl-3-methyl-5-hydroxy-6-metoxy-1,4-benzoquinol methylase